jgi:hypothetical protein
MMIGVRTRSLTPRILSKISMLLESPIALLDNEPNQPQPGQQAVRDGGLGNGAKLNRGRRYPDRG